MFSGGLYSGFHCLCVSQLSVVNMSGQTNRKKIAPVWDFFSVTADPKFATCNVCKKNISRGSGEAKKQSTFPLKRHLKTHPDQTKLLLEKEAQIEAAKEVFKPTPEDDVRDTIFAR